MENLSNNPIPLSLEQFKIFVQKNPFGAQTAMDNISADLKITDALSIRKSDKKDYDKFKLGWELYAKAIISRKLAISASMKNSVFDAVNAATLSADILELYVLATFFPEVYEGKELAPEKWQEMIDESLYSLGAHWIVYEPEIIYERYTHRFTDIMESAKLMNLDILYKAFADNPVLAFKTLLSEKLAPCLKIADKILEMTNLSEFKTMQKRFSAAYDASLFLNAKFMFHKN